MNINLTIKFPVDRQIRRYSNHIEDILSHSYGQPTIMPIPDEIDAFIPRIQFISKNNHSRILLSQMSIDFNVTFDDCFNKNFDSCKNYLQERIKLIANILTAINKTNIYYCGMTTVVREELSNENKKDIYEKYNLTKKEFYDFDIKYTFLKDETYHHNIRFLNYRDYKGFIENADNNFLANFSNAEISEFGLEKEIDLNDRYEYNKFGKTYDLSKLTARLTQMLEDTETYVTREEW